jgi:hypothetical protein
MASRSALWLLERGRQHLETAAAHVDHHEFAEAEAERQKAAECSAIVQSVLLTPNAEMDVRQAINSLKVDIRLMQARIKSQTTAHASNA